MEEEDVDEAKAGDNVRLKLKNCEEEVSSSARAQETQRTLGSAGNGGEALGRRGEARGSGGVARGSAGRRGKAANAENTGTQCMREALGCAPFFRACLSLGLTRFGPQCRPMQDLSTGFVLCHPRSLVKTARVFEAHLAIVEHKNIICAGFKAVLHIHTCVEEVTITV